MNLLTFLTRLIWSLIALLAGLTLLAILTFTAWTHLAPPKQPTPPAHREIADQLFPKALEDLRRYNTNHTPITIVHIVNDPSNFLTDELRRRIAESAIAPVTPPTLDEHVLRALRLEITSPISPSQAVARARGLGAPWVLFGRVLPPDSHSNPPTPQFELSLLDIDRYEPIFSQIYSFPSRSAANSPASAPPTPLSHTPPAPTVLPTSYRVLLAALATLLLPIFTIQFLQTLVRRRSNATNAIALLLYSSVDALFATLALDGWFPGGFSSLLQTGFILGSLTYNLWILSVLARREA